jgi:signal transduction histidine kinase
MRRLLDLSLSIKLPLWGSVLILSTAISLSIAMLGQAYDDFQRDLRRTSQSVGQNMMRSVVPLMLQDDLWRAFEVVRAPFEGRVESQALHPSGVIVLDRERRVYVASAPERFPLLAALSDLGPSYAALDGALAAAEGEALVVKGSAAVPSFLTLPIMDDQLWLGTLVVESSPAVIRPRLLRLIERVALVTAAILSVLLSLSWYWGRRMSKPLQQVAWRMERLRESVPEEVDGQVYPYADEVGRLFASYGEMVAQLRHKDSLEKQMIRAERLAAVGQLTAGIAHEINNPLGGMFNAISMLKKHGADDHLSLRLASILERGLEQIRETVGALLVEAKFESRRLTQQDLDDLRVLAAPHARRRHIALDWQAKLEAPVPLPSTLVRQLVLNLTLNALAAAAVMVTVRIDVEGNKLVLALRNDGKHLTREQMETLFEPFSRFSENGHGLGLWISYQIVKQLNGTIEASSDGGLTRFAVSLPLQEPAG